MRYEISHNLPIPPKRRGKPCKYPFGELKPGDSFDDERGNYRKVYDAARQYAKNHNKEFVVRVVYDPNKRIDVVRVWNSEGINVD